MGIEPTLAGHKPPNNGFEDRGRHQPPSASGAILAEIGSTSTQVHSTVTCRVQPVGRTFPSRHLRLGGI